MRYLLLLLPLLLLSCDEDQTVDRDDQDLITNPQASFETQQLTAITRTDDMGNLLESYQLEYTGQNLTTITVTGSAVDDETILLSYATNKQLIAIERNDMTGLLVQDCVLTYDTNLTRIECTTPTTVLRTDVSSDLSNRVGQVQLTQRVNNSFVGEGIFTYVYGQNEDANTILVSQTASMNGNLQLTYDVQENAFLNMNEILSHYLFRDYFPTGLHNPLTVSNPSTGQDRTLVYTYDAAGYPTEVEIMNNTAATQFVSYTYTLL